MNYQGGPSCAARLLHLIKEDAGRKNHVSTPCENLSMSGFDQHNTLVAQSVDEATVANVATTCAIGPLVSRVLVARGFDTPERVREFLSPSLERDWADPTCIPACWRSRIVCKLPLSLASAYSYSATST